MSAYLPWLGVPLQHGPWIAAGAMLLVTPGVLWLLSLALERRPIDLRGSFTAVLLGDPLLAAAVGLGVCRTRHTSPSGAAGPWVGLASMIVWFVFGMVQWRQELRTGYFTREQALAPSKIWHQVAVYPLLGYWLWTAGIGGLIAPGDTPGALAARVGIAACVVAWIAANGYDRRHPKLGHAPYDWRRLRAVPEPWPRTSVTLRAHAARSRHADPPTLGGPPRQSGWLRASGPTVGEGD